MTPFLLPRPSVRSRGVAIVVVLAFVVLLTVMVVAFLSRSLSERQISDSSASIARAETFGLGALDILSGLLKQEIADGSNAISAGGRTYYRPTNGDGIQPALSGVAAGGPANLLKVSADAQPLYPGGPVLATNILSTDSSAARNGRSISLARWNKALLLPKQNPAGTDLTPDATFPAPAWVYVSRDGAFPTTWSANLISSPTNNGAVVGRFAFAVYDEGGLLDANVAGFPASISANGTEVRGKGAVAWVNLADIGLSSPSITKLLEWRNAATGGSSTDFFNAVTKNQRGFLTVSGLGTAADRLFASRQQLIQFLDPDGTDATAQTALQYLGTFSREVAAPSWAPPATPTSTNLDVFSPSARALSNLSITSYYADGTPYTYSIKAGEPIASRRFNLQRLAWLGRNGPQNGGTDANIRACFGLKWVQTDNGKAAYRWDYVGPTGVTVQNAIPTLAQVAQAGREPNFFEMLKAAILSGSLGMTVAPVNTGANGERWPLPDAPPYNGTNRSYAPNGAANYSMTDGQIIQIGLNVIDQYDADSFPTRVRFGNFGTPATAKYAGVDFDKYTFCGSEALPYVYRVAITPYRPINRYGDVGDGDPTQRTYAAWYEPVLWSPARLVAAAAAVDEPPRFRFRSNNDAYVNLTGVPNTNLPCSKPPGDDTLVFSKGTRPSLGNATANPILLRDLVATGIAVAPGRKEMVFSADPGVNYVGMWAGQVGLPFGRDVNAVNYGLGGSPPNPCMMVLEADYSGSGAWLPIQWWAYGWVGGLYIGGNPNDDKYRLANRRPRTMGLSDPRTSRFGIQDLIFDPNFNALYPRNSDYPYNSDNGVAYTDYWPAQGIQIASNWNPGETNFTPNASRRQVFRYGDNSGTSGGPKYTDPDGTQRRADGSWDSAASNTLPMRSESDYRPVQLNRAFRSVGEMGYAFRDLPFRSLDLSTPNSADGGLLDFFSVSDADADTGLIAGKVNLNTRQAPVLSALLKGTAQRESPATNLSSTDANAIAQALVTQTKAPPSATAGPLTNRSDLAIKFGANAVFTSKPAFKIKTQREGAIRSLAEAGQTRTWNLMIDLVAQVGRFAAGSTSLKNFTVEGERRFWLHLAIDRFSGEVVDRQLEIVQE